MTSCSGPRPGPDRPVNRDVRVLPYGLAHALVELDTQEQVRRWHASIRRHRVEGVLEVIPAARTVLVHFDPERTGYRRLREELRTIPTVERDGQRAATGERHEQRTDEVVVPVRYDGPDLHEVSVATGLSRQEVVDRHVRATYTVAFCGFSPGFGYLTGLDPALHLPRRANPRTSVPPGSIALADEYTGIYPRSSPGGWRLIGHSDLVAWDPRRSPPALFTPGTRVRFEATGTVSAPISGPVSPGVPHDCRVPDGDESLGARATSRPPRLEVLATGPSATVQDLGRPGFGELGVGASGALDRPSLRLANRLVGNPESHAGIEVTFGGLRVRFTRAALIAVTGAPCPLTVSGRQEGMYAPIYVHSGQVLVIGQPTSGMRSYLAVRGGVDVQPVLGARATDTMADLGPPPLSPGSALPIGSRSLPYPNVGLAPQPSYPGLPVLRVLPGPRDDWFVDTALDTLVRPDGYEVTTQSNRIGIRLAGPALAHRDPRELPPEPTVTGALQVPPNGQPILFLADHPVTGGYPVVGVVHPDDLPLAAQARPGQRIRFLVTRSLDRCHAPTP